jgi:hypothetical protein
MSQPENNWSNVSKLVSNQSTCAAASTVTPGRPSSQLSAAVTSCFKLMAVSTAAADADLGGYLSGVRAQPTLPT